MVTAYLTYTEKQDEPQNELENLAIDYSQFLVETLQDYPTLIFSVPKALEELSICFHFHQFSETEDPPGAAAD
jgi:hypothetical protein